MKDNEFLQRKYIVNTYVNRQLSLVKGEGLYLIDEKNNKYLDLMSNYGVSIFGYKYKSITDAILKQMKTLPTLHGSFINDTRSITSQALVDRCGEAYSQVYWSSSGAEAIEAALKFTVLFTNKKKFIVCKNGYHGKTLGTLSATSGSKYKKPFKPLLWDFIEIPFNDSAALERVINNEVAGFIVEPIQGEGGIYVPDSGYLKNVRDICIKHKILLIIDEIQTGLGRTGMFLASQKEEVSADILCLGKGLAGGIPIGATLVNRDIALIIPKHINTSTFGGNPLACAGVLATLNAIDENRLKHIRYIGQYFKEQLLLLRSSFIFEVRGEGLMLGISIKDKRNHILKKLQKHNILAIPSGEDVVRFLPPYILEKKHVDVVIKTLQIILNELE